MPLGFPGGSVIKTLLADARDMGLIPDLGSLIPQAAEQLSLCATTSKPVFTAQEPQLLSPSAAAAQPLSPRACALQWEKPLQGEACVVR